MAIIDKTNYKNASTFYQKLFDGVFSEDGSNYLAYADEFTVTGTQYEYRFSTKYPRLKKLVGEKMWQSLRANKFTIKIEPFHKGVEVEATDYYGDPEGVGRDLTEFLQKNSLNYAVVEHLVKGNSGGSGELCYDGVSFFNGSHPYGPNGGTQSNRGTATLSEANYETARATMMSLRDEEGNSLGIKPDTLIVSPTKEATARKILERAITVDSSAGVSNIHSNDGVKILVEPTLEEELDGADADDYWFLIDSTKAPIVIPTLTGLFPRDNVDQLNTDSDKLKFEVLGRLGIGYGLWQAAYGSFATS